MAFQFRWLLFIGIFSIVVKSEVQHIQAIHVLDPAIEEFKYYASWNSDQWIQILRQRYIQDLEGRRTPTNENGLENSDDPLYGLYVNIILISSVQEINSAFSGSSNKTYPDDPSRGDYYWSDTSFPSYVVVRKIPKAVTASGEKETSQYNVYNCSGKKMFVNAKVDPVTLHPIVIQTLFPKKVKNPKDKLKIPLVVCSKVSQVRGLLDEIRFQLGGNTS